MTVPSAASATTAVTTTAVTTVARLRHQRGRRRRAVILGLVGAVLVALALNVLVGQTFYSPAEVMAVVLGQDAGGATFTIGRLRLPRAILGAIVGLSFGLAGVAFQTMLRNPLASPDIIGISAGSSAAAAFAIVMLGLSGFAVSAFAIIAGLLVALLIYLLSSRSGSAGTRLILIGIGIAAMLDALTQYVLSQAGQWDLQEALRWLNGSLNGATWNEVITAGVALLVIAPVLLSRSRDLAALQLGDDTAAAIGTRVARTRLIVVVTAVSLIAFATATTGPIAFVAFLSGPIAARVIGPRGSLLIPSALIGALLVLVADFVGQYALGIRYPVGIVTGVLGAPYLLYLIIRTNRAGGSL